MFTHLRSMWQSHLSGRLERLLGVQQSAARFRNSDSRFVPDFPVPDDGDESLDVWGFRDTRFVINSRGNVELSGTRYALCGQELPALLPWVQDVLGVSIDPEDVHEEMHVHVHAVAPKEGHDNAHTPTSFPAIPDPIDNPGFSAAIAQILDPDQIDQTPEIRRRHGHGHTQHEMYAIKYGRLPRVPDMVVYPTSEEQVLALVRAAREHDVCLIPFGGGTNVTEALLCPDDEQRTIVSVDMRRMNRILWIDPTNRMACIQAGAVGRHIVEGLKQHGFTMGHEPDSVEFSTLGGWIATHASGMKKNKYGNIEDLVVDVHVATADGMLTRSAQHPRESIGADPRRWILGSEGNLGIVTQAVVKLFPLPEAQRYGSILFPCLEDGVSFLYALTQAGNPPASVRLVDNLQFQFSMALKPAAAGGLQSIKKQLEKLYVTRVRGFDPQRMVACTLVFEGTTAQVEEQEKQVYAIAERFGGMAAGAENGHKGYELTFSIAYIRDFVMRHYVLAESFETSVCWSRVLELIDNVKRRIHEEHQRRNLPGKPYVTARLTQVYATGVAVYFYYGYYHKGVANPSAVYSEIEAAARDEILKSGGSLSHHHGIGKLRQKFLPRIMSETALAWNRAAKQTIDPQNIFGCRNQQMGDQAALTADVASTASTASQAPHPAAVPDSDQIASARRKPKALAS